MPTGIAAVGFEAPATDTSDLDSADQPTHHFAALNFKDPSMMEDASSRV
jgi:hypothetical protein